MANRKQLIQDIFQNMSAMRRSMLEQSVGTKRPKDAPTHAEVGILFALQEREQSVKEIAGCFGMTSSAITQFVTNLVKHKLLVRKPDKRDRRKVLLSITPQGKRALKAHLKQKSALFAERLSVLSDKELLQLKTIQEKIITASRSYAKPD